MDSSMATKIPGFSEYFATMIFTLVKYQKKSGLTYHSSHSNAPSSWIVLWLTMSALRVNVFRLFGWLSLLSTRFWNKDSPYRARKWTITEMASSDVLNRIGRLGIFIFTVREKTSIHLSVFIWT
jgi:hypothetical protein